MNKNVSFEELWAQISSMRAPATKDRYEIFWVIQRVLGLARSGDGSIELFLPGPKVFPSTHVVRRHMEHGQWEIESSRERIEANRLVFPGEDHFVGIAALISREFIRHGIDQRPLQLVVNSVEPTIELALRRGALQEEQVIGLIGELILLECLLDSISGAPEYRMSALDMWQGYQSGGRDFRIGPHSIEVKTTRQETSSHRIAGLNQVSLSSNPGGEEHELWLFSVGLATSGNDGQSLPEIVQRILEKLSDPLIEGNSLSNLQARFLENVSKYCSEFQEGYQHQSMSMQKPFLMRFRPTFTPRLYDLLDEEIRIIRASDVANTIVEPSSLQYQFNLPDLVNGANPTSSWRHSIIHMVSSYFDRTR